jgi:hypothetical protein
MANYLTASCRPITSQLRAVSRRGVRLDVDDSHLRFEDIPISSRTTGGAHWRGASPQFAEPNWNRAVVR